MTDALALSDNNFIVATLRLTQTAFLLNFSPTPRTERTGHERRQTIARNLES